MMDPDVVIVGAGPVGLMLAVELGLAEIRAVVLERAEKPAELPKANGLVGHIVRVLSQRGLLDGVPDFRPISPPRFPFGPISLELSSLPINPLHILPIPQGRLETLLESRATELGADIRRGSAVVDIVDGPDHVTLRTAGHEERTITAQYVIGCDGARSFVRKAAGIAFPGHTSDEISRMARVRLPVPIATDGQTIDIAGVGSIPLFRQHRTATGGISIAPLSALDPSATGDSYLVSTREPRGAEVADDHLSDAELSASIRRVLGVDLPIISADWVRSTVANSRLVDRYRVGRIFLAGDAAHLFSAGGSALNVGMLDAVNLGWKLAAEIAGRAPEDLLDSYHAERYPAGARALLQTRAQSALSSSDADTSALRELLTGILRSGEALRTVAEALEGSDAVDPASDPRDSPASRWAPDAFPGGASARAVAEAMRQARPVLIDATPNSVLHHAAADWAGRVRLVDCPSEPIGGQPGSSALIRPDGYLAWLSKESEPATAGLVTALRAWFGPPGTPLAPDRERPAEVPNYPRSAPLKCGNAPLAAEYTLR